MIRTPAHFVRIAVLLAGAAASVTAQTPPPGPPPAAGSRMITPNFTNVPIEQLAEAVGEATNTTFIVDPRVRAQVSLVNPRAMTANELYYAFLSILQVHNFAALRSGNIVKIVPDVNARQMPGNDLPSSLGGGGDEMVTTVIEVKNISANQLATVLRQLQPQYGLLQPIPGTNSMVITDRASNVARIQRIVNRVDQTGNNNVEVIPLQNATAGDLVRTLNALTAGQPADAAAGLVPRVVADDRTNSVLISGDPAQRLRIATWIAHLDTPLENGGGTEVVYLKYADAEALAAKLKEQATGVAAAAAGGAAGAAAGGASADRSVTIWPHKETNAIVITAPPKMMRSLRTVIDKLDIPRAQVLVEAIIADVSTTKSADLGVNWALFSNENGTSVPVGGFVNPVGSANGNSVSIVDLTRAVLNPATATTVPLGTTMAVGRLRDNGINFGAMIRALRADGNSNVIATPSITATDNQTAEFKSAQEVPFITGQYTNSTSTGTGVVNPFTTVQRQEVGTILKITPQINGGNAMTLKVEVESSELTGKTGDAGSAITLKRSFKTEVLVENGATVVVAGLIRDAKNTGETRVPFLGRIPIIGEAFKTRNGTREKTNLMVFIRPKIMTDSLQSAIETNSKYNLIRDAQIKQGNTHEVLPLLPFDKPPQLPPAPPVPAPTPWPAPSSASPPPPAAPATTRPVPADGKAAD
ncbi:MAG: type II secretion system secretin GspD [Steroidobacteraceae bacterium]